MAATTAESVVKGQVVNGSAGSIPGNGRDGGSRSNILLDMLPVAILLVLITAALGWLLRHRHARDRLWWLAWTVPLVGLAGIIVLVASDLGIQKVVGRLLMPAGLVWVVLLAVTVGSAMMGAWRRAVALLMITLLYTAAGNIWLGAALVRPIEASVPPVDLATVERFDAVCVLGGGTTLNQHGQPQLGNSGERVVHGARCFFAGKTPLLVAMGSGLRGVNRDLAAETKEIWISLGVPEAAIITVPGPTITRAEITALHELARKRGWERVGLVSSAWHLPRALRHAAHLEFAPIPLPCDRLGGGAPAWFLHLIPHHDGFERTHTATWEWLGSLVGR